MFSFKDFLKKIIEADKTKNPDQNYFTEAKSWADEFYTSTVKSRNKWRALSLFVEMPIIFLLLICVTLLIPAQHLEPLMINHYSDGETIVTPIKQHYAPSNSEQVESDIARYIRFRESYSPDTYDYSYRLIHLMSAQNVYTGYQAVQNTDNKSSPISALGNKGYETVKVESIVFLDNENKNAKNKKSTKNGSDLSQIHHNLAQVDFVVITHDKLSNAITSKPLTALISWKYRGMPSDPNERWMDWNGFTVQSYEVTQRNI